MLPIRNNTALLQTITIARDVVLEVLYLAPAAAMILVSLMPGQALAVSMEIELAHQPLRFVRDPSLSGVAIVGIEAFPSQRTAGSLLRSRSSTIADAAGPVREGMAYRVLATAYSSTHDQTDGNPFITASGAYVAPDVLAANFAPLGTVVRIGDAEYTVLDRMNSRYNGKYIIDIWFPTRAEALAFGVRVLELEIVSLP